MKRTSREQREIEARNKLVQGQRARSAVQTGTSVRHEIALLAPKGCVGVECGVDTGQFSERLWNTGQFRAFHSVDKWDDIAHPESQYWAACEKLITYEGVRIWRMTAQQFATIAGYAGLQFGFIYMDCYAHTGQDDGGVLDAMWPLLEDGGLFAGDDYDAQKWPDNYRIVNEFAERVSRDVQVYSDHMDQDRPKYDGYPSWYFYKGLAPD